MSRLIPAIAQLDRQGFGPTPRGIEGGMELSLLLIMIGIVLAVLVNYALGIVCILIGLVLLICRACGPAGSDSALPSEGSRMLRP